LVNSILGGPLGSRVAPAPTVGMGGTVLGWSDRYAVTVVAVSKSGREVSVTTDTATRTDTNGMSESQTYEFTSNMNHTPRVYRLGKYGWREKGSGGKGSALRLGYRSAYHDYTF
jgi:hypothetical protein